MLGTQASGVTALGRTVLKSLEIEVQPIILEKAADGPPMLLDGRADALWGAGVGWPAFTALAKAGGRFIAPSAAEVERILSRRTLAAGGDAAGGQLPGAGSRRCRRSARGATCSQRQAAGRRRATCSPARCTAPKAKLAARLEQARETTMANTVAAAPRPELIHPGVRKYLQEAGLLAAARR